VNVCVSQRIVGDAQGGRTGPRRAVAAVVLVGLFVSALLLSPPGAGARGGKIRLTAEVLKARQGNGSTCGYPTEVRLSEGARDAGIIKVSSCAAAGTGVYYRGSAMLEVGKLQGHLHFGVAFHAEPPDFTAPKSGAGMVYDAEGSERIEVEGPNLPSEVGASFVILVNPKLFPPN
jgi:hypothetical protein